MTVAKATQQPFMTYIIWIPPKRKWFGIKCAYQVKKGYKLN